MGFLNRITSARGKNLAIIGWLLAGFVYVAPMVGLVALNCWGWLQVEIPIARYEARQPPDSRGEFFDDQARRVEVAVWNCLDEQRIVVYRDGGLRPRLERARCGRMTEEEERLARRPAKPDPASAPRGPKTKSETFPER
jgi:hypothetical protein